MEESPYVGRTMAIFEELRTRMAENVGIVLQAYLRQRAGDVEAQSGRLADPDREGWLLGDPGVVYRVKAEIDQAFSPRCPAAARAVAPSRRSRPTIRRRSTWPGRSSRSGIAPGSFEFQMLYGVAPGPPGRLVRDGYPVRCYVPYGGDWFVYFLGCLAAAGRLRPPGQARVAARRRRAA